MRKIFIIILSIVALGFVTSCADFEDVNKDPKAASLDQVQVEYLLNKSIGGAQMDPHIAERVFILYWKSAGRQHIAGGIVNGSANDGWTNDYYSYLQGWIKSATLAVNTADDQIKGGKANVWVNNLMQCSRIWRAYLYSELTDNFGPSAFNETLGVLPEFKSEKECYAFMLKELKESVKAIDPTKGFGGNNANDPAYGYDFNKWIKFGNSLRMRLAMRISNSTADPALAKAEFEDAVREGKYISDKGDIFSVKENNGWDDFTAVMSRQWNSNIISATLNNLMINLGGITTVKSIGSKYPIAAAVKPADYFGVRYEKHYASYTNDPSIGFWFDGLYNTMDPRAYVMFQIPGNHDDRGKEGKNFDENYCYYPGWTNDARTQTVKMEVKAGYTPNTEPIVIDATYTWNAFANGAWGDAGSVCEPRGFTGKQPCLKNHYRGGEFKGQPNRRVFFAAWESYFLIAEAAVKGWSVGMSAKDAYERGVKASFEYNGIPELAAEYLTSEDYNRVGTSVKWEHTAEATPVVYNCVNGYTGVAETTTWKKPSNTIYGPNNNDVMNKILTQKFIAQTPWLPLETWSDHRRLGLPFFENSAVELPIQTLPDLNQANAKIMNKTTFFPQRLKYPSGLENSNPTGYAKAVQLLGGKDDVLTPLWWAKR